ncbi:MAG: DUF4221 family protein [Cyclobacteriaceae bacterium]
MKRDTIQRLLTILLVSQVCVYIISCKNPESKSKTTSIDSLTLKPLRTVRIVIDSMTSGFSPLEYYSKDTSKHLYLLNSNLNTLQVYKMSTGQLIKAISFPVNIGTPVHFTIHNRDTIFLVDPHRYQLSIINWNGDLINQIRLISDINDYKQALIHPPPLATKDKYIANPTPSNKNPIYIVDNQIYIECVPWMDPLKADFFRLGKVKMKIDLRSNQIEYFMGFPDLYRENLHFPTQFFSESSVLNRTEKTFVFSFPADPYIYTTTLDGTNMKKYWAGSKYFEVSKPLNRKTEDNIRHAEHAINNFHFERICYDPYRDVYYRLVWHPDTEKPFSFSDQGNKISIRLSIIILDSQFNKVGEAMLPKEVTNTFIFPTEAGLYIQNGIVKDDEMIFTLFDLTIK